MKIIKILLGTVFLLILSAGLILATGFDVNNDGVVNAADLTQILKIWGVTGIKPEDINEDQKVNLSDAGLVIKDWGKVVITPTPFPTTSPLTPSEWTQFGHDPQRTNYTAQVVTSPWRFKWQWNGSGSDGKKQSSHIAIPDLVQPITGGGLVYIAAGNKGIYALNSSNGSITWNRNPGGLINTTPAYDSFTGSLFVLSSSGILYKLNSQTGETISQFNTNSSPVNALAPLLLSDRVIIAVSSKVYAINKENLQQLWVYNAGAETATSPAYSAFKNKIIVGSEDLYIHIINNANGQIACNTCKIKPTPRTPGDPASSQSNNFAELINGWPVVADQHGIVFVRYRLDWNTLWTWNPFPNTNEEIRNNLSSNSREQTLFAINLDNGSLAFIPAVGNGGMGDGGWLTMGPLPIIANLDEEELAYIIWRNGRTCASQGWCDGREDATMGEMVLDNKTVCPTQTTCYQAGDVRFVRFQDIQTDEMIKITMSGRTIFHSHWLINAAATITSNGRNSSLGETFQKPIETTNAPFAIWRQCGCSGGSGSCTSPCGYPGCTNPPTCFSSCKFNAQSHYCSSELYSYGDTRAYPPGFYEYFNDFEADGETSPFTVVSNGLILIKTIDGGLIALEEGNPL